MFQCRTLEWVVGNIPQKIGMIRINGLVRVARRTSDRSDRVGLYRKPGGQTVDMNKLILILVAAVVAVALDIAPLPAQDTPDLFRQAAEQGTAGAQYNLGLMYAIGRGVLKDATLAHMWLNIAGANGSEIAREERDTIEDDMTATQIARATELARTCMDSDYENCEGVNPRTSAC